MRHVLLLACVCVAALAAAPPAFAGENDESSLPDRVEELQQELDSLIEEVEDLQEPVEEFSLFDECMYLIGVSAHGKRDGSSGYVFGARDQARRPALAMDMRGFGLPQFQFLAFPGEEPPSIECNEDAGEEFVDG